MNKKYEKNFKQANIKNVEIRRLQAEVNVLLEEPAKDLMNRILNSPPILSEQIKFESEINKFSDHFYRSELRTALYQHFSIHG